MTPPVLSSAAPESSCHTKPEQIRCRVASVSAEESNAHHGAAGSHDGAVGTGNASACCVSVDVNDFCHVEAKDKLLLLMEIGGSARVSLL